MTPPLANRQTPGLAALAVGTAILSYVALELIAVPREWQVAICLALVAVLGVVAGAALRSVKWVHAAAVLAVVSTIMFTVNDYFLTAPQRWWILGFLLYFPGALAVAFVSAGLGRAVAK